MIDYFNKDRKMVVDTKILFKWTDPMIGGSKFEEFHCNVAGKQKTICFIYTPKGLFGGYTDVVWQKPSHDEEIKQNGNSFVFFYENDQLLICKNKADARYEVKHSFEHLFCMGGSGPYIQEKLMNDGHGTVKGVANCGLTNWFEKPEGYDQGDKKDFNLLSNEFRPEVQEVEVY